jgi:hypothetical protein
MSTLRQIRCTAWCKNQLHVASTHRGFQFGVPTSSKKVFNVFSIPCETVSGSSTKSFNCSWNRCADFSVRARQTSFRPILFLPKGASYIHIYTSSTNVVLGQTTKRIRFFSVSKIGIRLSVNIQYFSKTVYSRKIVNISNIRLRELSLDIIFLFIFAKMNIVPQILTYTFKWFSC